MITMLEERDAHLVGEAEREIEAWAQQVHLDRQALESEREQMLHEARQLRDAAVVESEEMLRAARNEARRLLEAAMAEADRLVAQARSAAWLGGAGHGD